MSHDDVIKHFPRPFVCWIHRSPVNSPHKGQWRGALMSSLICVWTNGWISNRDAGDLRSRRARYDATVMMCKVSAILFRPRCGKLLNNGWHSQVFHLQIASMQFWIVAVTFHHNCRNTLEITLSERQFIYYYVTKLSPKQTCISFLRVIQWQK